LFFEGVKENAESYDEEVIFRNTLLGLQRRLRSWVDDDLYRAIRVINLSHHITGEPVYYVPEELADVADQTTFENIRSMVELVFVGITTRQSIEVIGDFITEGIFDCKEINSLLEQNRQSIRFEIDSKKSILRVHLLPESDITEESSDEIPNVRTLFDRMKDAFEREDYGAVLHTSASVFETLMKDQLQLSRNGGTLDSMIEPYSRVLHLPDEIRAYMKKQYVERNRTPLAGHGSVESPNISKQEAIVIIEMTRMIVRLHGLLPTSESVGGR
jgi:hypothetical protein